MDEHGLRAVVRGRVQGVGFRYFVLGTARQLGIRGTVRNQRDGSVEVVAIGPADTLERLLQELRRGPAGAIVHSLDRERLDPPPAVAGFEIID